MNQEKIIDSFEVEDERGQRHIMTVFQQFIDASDLRGPKWIPGLKRLVLDTGERCKPGSENGLFLGLNRGQKYRKV